MDDNVVKKKGMISITEGDLQLYLSQVLMNE